MMGKVSLQDLASVLVDRWHLGKKEASMFVNEMFFVIQKSLNEDKIVKVKGLGTFKIIDVDDRESVDVNTGDRVLIEGHGKITFTPDALMKELVNKPFSQFETVVLKDGIDFDEAYKQTDEAVIAVPEEESEASSVPLVEFVDEPQMETVEEPVKPVVQNTQNNQSTQNTPKTQSTPNNPIVQEAKAEENKEPDATEEPEISDEPAVAEEKPAVASDEPAVVEEEPMVVEEESAFKKYFKWIGVALLILAVGVLIGYLMGNRSNNQSQTPQIPSAETVKNEAPKGMSVASDSINDNTEVEEESLDEDGEAEEEEEEAATDVVVTKEETASLDKWETMDARIRTGAYRIVGTDTVVKARAGDNFARLSKRFLGPGMECYIQVYNGLSAGAVLSADQEIKIPKIELKKKRKKKE
jgi:nucleoid DNA-binding protein